MDTAAIDNITRSIRLPIYKDEYKDLYRVLAPTNDSLLEKILLKIVDNSAAQYFIAGHLDDISP